MLNARSKEKKMTRFRELPIQTRRFSSNEMFSIKAVTYIYCFRVFFFFTLHIFIIC